MPDTKHKTKIKMSGAGLYYGSRHALRDISAEIQEHTITAIIGPSGCGKSSLLRLFNRMNDLIPKARLEGSVFLDDADIYDDVLTSRESKGADYTDTNPERYKGIRIVPLAQWPKDIIVAAVASSDLNSNFWAGVGYADDAEVIQIDKLSNPSELYFFKMLMKADTNIVFGEDIVLYDGSTTETIDD